MSPKQRMLDHLERLKLRLTTDWQGEGVRVTEAVVVAVDEVLAELQKPRTDWYLVATLLSFKSYVCGALFPNEPFCEDHEHNQTVLGEGVSVYSILDGLQFRAAMLADVMPAGMTAYTAGGKHEERYPRDEGSPTLRNIAIADALVTRRCRPSTDTAEEGDDGCKSS
ncbi:MAG: hypothetical protein ABFE07_17820 [Armatimonadia bacterium]